jgi:alkanesulfonate monooxygenase SsuD/methylene tetrahydromethanopterin reductase-like flavin-dependent oxidoreductase (luciferase family)
MLAALRRLLTERDVSFGGRYYRFERDDRAAPAARPELWVGGGSKIQTSLSPTSPTSPPPSWRGSRAPTAGSPAPRQQMVKDVRTIRDYLAGHGRDPDTLLRPELPPPGHDTTDREEALRLRARSSSA